MLCIKNNENPKHLNHLIDALLFTDQPTAEYCDAIQRAFNIRQSYLVPFFGNFIKDLHTIFQSMSSLAVRAYSQATINQFINSPAQPSANLHLGDRRQLEFLFDYNSNDHFMSRIGVGNLVNVEKMNAAERVIQNIGTFHIHSSRRSIDLAKCVPTTSKAVDFCDGINLNANSKLTGNQSDTRPFSESKEGEKVVRDEKQPAGAVSSQCTPEQQTQPLNNSDLHESTSLMNIGNLTQSASISAGNLNSFASTTTQNAGSMPLSPFPTINSTQTFQQQQQRISTISNTLQQINSSNNNVQSNQPIVATPVSPNTTTGLDSTQSLLDDNNNRLGEQNKQSEQTTESVQCLQDALKKEQQNKEKSGDVFENDSLYELDHKHNYKPIQPLPYNHGVSFIPLSGEKYYTNLNALQMMQHGTLNGKQINY